MAKAPDQLPPEVLAAFERGQPIEAIKLLLRSRANGLMPSALRPPPQPHQVKPQPDKAAARPTPLAKAQRTGLSPGELPRSSSSVWLFVVAALLAYAGFRLFGG